MKAKEFEFDRNFLKHTKTAAMSIPAWKLYQINQGQNCPKAR